MTTSQQLDCTREGEVNQNVGCVDTDFFSSLTEILQ